MRQAIRHLKQQDPVMAGLIDRIGPYKPKYCAPDYETLVRSIVSQQLSSKAAATIYGRLVEATRGVAPESVLKLRTPRLRSIGLSKQKAAYIRDLARQTARGQLRFDALVSLTDEAVIEQLTAVKGIGVWTAQMFLMFGLRRPDVLPTGDLGIRNAIHRVYGLAQAPKPVEMEAIGCAWRPYRSVACLYLWRSLASG
ncbi:MAG: DNA-3-methyladenine glycosylase family protein [Bryobacteraceae bacterium]